MLLGVGLILAAACLASQSSARTAVTLLHRDYSSVPAKLLLASNMRSVLERMSAVQAVHPRLRRLYALLQRELRLAPQHGALHHAISLSRALQPAAYDVNKLNRIYTTSTEWIA